jgi:hypothetical protein
MGADRLIRYSELGRLWEQVSAYIKVLLGTVTVSCQQDDVYLSQVQTLQFLSYVSKLLRSYSATK